MTKKEIVSSLAPLIVLCVLIAVLGNAGTKETRQQVAPKQSLCQTGKHNYDYELEYLKNQVRYLEQRVQSLEWTVRDLQEEIRKPDKASAPQ